MYGEPVPTYLSEFMTGRGRPAESGALDGDGRRSVYLAIRRNFLSPFMLTFDMPIPFSTFGRRNSSNVPAQSLTMLNDPFVVAQAQAWAEQLVAQTDLTPEQKIRFMYQTALSRNASEAEIADGLAFIKTQAQLYNLSAEEALQDVRVWKDLGHALLNLKEFIYLI